MATRHPLAALAIAALLSALAACGFTGEPDPGWATPPADLDGGAPLADMGLDVDAAHSPGPEPEPDADMGAGDFDGAADMAPDAAPPCPPAGDAGPETDGDLPDGDLPDGDLIDAGDDPCAPDAHLDDEPDFGDEPIDD